MRSLPKEIEKLYNEALKAREFAKVQHSGFKVGAAIETVDGKIYTGCNIESSSYGLTVCAERVALLKALSEGDDNFKRILVVAETKNVCSPCGACRQLIYDYAPDVDVIMTNLEKDYVIEKIEDLLKYPFRLTK